MCIDLETLISHMYDSEDSQSFQEPLIKEHTLKCNKDIFMIQGLFLNLGLLEALKILAELPLTSASQAAASTPFARRGA